MAARDDILALGQKIYLASNGRFNDLDAGSEEEDEFVDKTINIVNQFFEELELEADWNWLRENDASLGTISTSTTSFTLDEAVRKLVASPYRTVNIVQDGTPISHFVLVSPNQIADPLNPDTQDRCTVVNRTLLFSRDFTDEEIGATVTADIINYIPALSLTDVDALDLVDPIQLVVLGCAKNGTLPDVVQGGISPALAQKYNDLLEKAKMANDQTSQGFNAFREDFSFIGRV